MSKKGGRKLRRIRASSWSDKVERKGKRLNKERGCYGNHQSAEKNLTSWKLNLGVGKKTEGEQKNRCSRRGRRGLTLLRSGCANCIGTGEGG